MLLTFPVKRVADHRLTLQRYAHDTWDNCVVIRDKDLARASVDDPKQVLAKQRQDDIPSLDRISRRTHLCGSAPSLPWSILLTFALSGIVVCHIHMTVRLRVPVIFGNKPDPSAEFKNELIVFYLLTDIRKQMKAGISFKDLSGFLYWSFMTFQTIRHLSIRITRDTIPDFGIRQWKMVITLMENKSWCKNAAAF